MCLVKGKFETPVFFIEQTFLTPIDHSSTFEITGPSDESMKTEHHQP